MSHSSFNAYCLIQGIVILLLYLGLGYLLAWSARDELKQAKKWVRMIIIISVVIGPVLMLLGQKSVGISLIGIAVASGVSYYQKNDA